MSELKPIPTESLNKALFGVCNFDDLFVKVIYGKDYHPHGGGTATARPKGWRYIHVRDMPDRVENWLDDRVLRGNLSVLPREHVTQACQYHCCKGSITSFEIIPWKHTGHALVVATDGTGIPSIYVAFIPLDTIPEINSKINEVWDGRDGQDYAGELPKVLRVYDQKGKRHTKFEAVINGFSISLDIDMEGDGPDSPDVKTGCWINYKDYGASLESLLVTGTLDDNDSGDTLDVSEETQKKICQWADERGYGGDPDKEWGGRYGD